jgi:hypothetical protein
MVKGSKLTPIICTHIIPQHTLNHTLHPKPHTYTHSLSLSHTHSHTCSVCPNILKVPFSLVLMDTSTIGSGATPLLPKGRFLHERERMAVCERVRVCMCDKRVWYK